MCNAWTAIGWRHAMAPVDEPTNLKRGGQHHYKMTYVCAGVRWVSSTKSQPTHISQAHTAANGRKSGGCWPRRRGTRERANDDVPGARRCAVDDVAGDANGRERAAAAPARVAKGAGPLGFHARSDATANPNAANRDKRCPGWRRMGAAPNRDRRSGARDRRSNAIAVFVAAWREWVFT